MQSFFQLVIRNSFKTLPDGKCVFLKAGFFTSTCLLIPDAMSETILKNKIFWVNTISWILIIGGVFVFVYYTDTNFYIACLIPFIGRVLSWITRSLIVSKDISNFKKLNYKHETFYFYDNFTNKVDVGKNKIPPKYEIAKYLDVPDNDDKILLLRYKDSSPIILRCALGGWIIWQSEIAPEFNNTLAGIEWFNHRILVSNGYTSSTLLDANTGSIIENK